MRYISVNPRFWLLKCFFRSFSLLFALMPFVLLCLLVLNAMELSYSDWSPHLIINPGGPKAAFLVVQTKKSSGWCRMTASSIFSNISVITIGLGRHYVHVHRPLWIIEYIETAGLKDEDIIVSFDGGDTVLTGFFTIRRAIQRFINITPPTADMFESAAVKRGDVTPPLLFGSDAYCFAPHMTKFFANREKNHMKLCEEFLQNASRSAGLSYTSSRGPVEPGNASMPYLNAGQYIARVWALKRAMVAYSALLTSRTDFWCDQSLWTLLYGWSLDRGNSISPQMLLPFGLIGIDFRFDFFISPFPQIKPSIYSYWSETHIEKALHSGLGELPFFCHVHNNNNATPIVIHFPGSIQSRSKVLKGVISCIPWLRQIHRDDDSLQMVREHITNHALVDMRKRTKTKRLIHFKHVCSVDKVLNITWLFSPQRKK